MLIIFITLIYYKTIAKILIEMPTYGTRELAWIYLRSILLFYILVLAKLILHMVAKDYYK